ncbi:MAG TPA: MFS transporter [Solirubrobacteraceae bacterium]|nr:MFS transporter [Solirubrobacteraceae bacterium]
MSRKWWTLGAVSTGIFMLLLDVTIVNVALPDIQRTFHAPLSDLQWTIDAYALSLAAFLLTGGALADQFGRRRLFAIGLAIFTLGSALCGLASGSLFLILARAGQGIGGAIVYATSLALIAQAFPIGRERAVAFGIAGAITGVAIAVGPVLGGVLTSGISWRWIFFVNLPTGVLALIVTMTKVQESRSPIARRPDFLGFLTFGGGLIALTYGLIRSNPDGWTSATVIGSLAAATALLVAFVVVERRQRLPMFDLGLLRVPTFVGGLAAALALSGSLFSVVTYLILYFQQALHLSAAQTGVRFLPLTVAIFVASAIAGRVSDRVPTRWLIAPGFALVGTGLMLMRGISTGSTWTHLLSGMIVAGVGAGMVSVPLAATAVGVVEPARAGMASGINTTFRQVGTATGVATLGSIFASHIRASVSHALSPGMTPHVAGIAHAAASGRLGAAVTAASPSARLAITHAGRAGFVDGLNVILLIGAGVAVVAALVTVLTVRERDLVQPTHEPRPAATGLAESAPAAA